MEAMGLGNIALRRVPTDGACQMDMAALRAAVIEDRASGLHPACVIATAGTVNTGALDDLGAIADLCTSEGMWMHVDGCIGALLSIAPQGGALGRGLARASSNVPAPTTCLHAPFNVGGATVRDDESPLQT